MFVIDYVWNLHMYIKRYVKLRAKSMYVTRLIILLANYCIANLLIDLPSKYYFFNWPY